MSYSHNGFSAVEGLVVVAFIMVAGSLGIVAWNTFMQPSEVASTSSTSNTSSQVSAEVITTENDLQLVEKELDEIDFNDVDAAEAEAQAEL